MTHDVDLIDGGRAGRRRLPGVRVRGPRWLRRALLTAACAALAVAAVPRGGGAPPALRATGPGSCVTAEHDVETAARLRAREAQRAQIRAVPAAYRDAARRASAYTHGLVQAEFFLALAYNRTLYGAMLANPATRPHSARGPLQWDLQRFSAVAVLGHRDATQPLDAFLAVGESLLRAGATEADDVFVLSQRLGAGLDQARADAEAFDVLTKAPPAPAAVESCAAPNA
jgi:hypothetical protein